LLLLLVIEENVEPLNDDPLAARATLFEPIPENPKSNTDISTATTDRTKRFANETKECVKVVIVGKTAVGKNCTSAA
jgi:predicted GTPase